MTDPKDPVDLDESLDDALTRINPTQEQETIPLPTQEPDVPEAEETLRFTPQQHDELMLLYMNGEKLFPDVDPYIKPTSAAELLRRYATGERRFPGAILADQDLAGAVLDDCIFICSSFERANLQGASLQRCDLRGTNFDSADLTNASLNDSRLG